MNLVDELQESATKDDVLSVLRNTRRLASKLKRHDIAEWLQTEQDGYKDGQLVPDYRRIRTTLAYNTNGYIPAGFGMVRSGIEELHAFDLNVSLPIPESISEVLSVIASLGSKGTFSNRYGKR